VYYGKEHNRPACSPLSVECEQELTVVFGGRE